MVTLIFCRPYYFAVVPSSIKLYVSYYGEAAGITLINTTTDTVVHTIFLDYMISYFAFSLSGSYALLGVNSSLLYSWDTSGDTPFLFADSLATLPLPTEMAVGDLFSYYLVSNQIYLQNTTAPSPGTETLLCINLRCHSTALAATPDGKQLYIALTDASLLYPAVSITTFNTGVLVGLFPTPSTYAVYAIAISNVQVPTGTNN